MKDSFSAACDPVHRGGGGHAIRTQLATQRASQTKGKSAPHRDLMFFATLFALLRKAVVFFDVAADTKHRWIKYAADGYGAHTQSLSPQKRRLVLCAGRRRNREPKE